MSTFDVSTSKSSASSPSSPLKVFKEVFNWYPSEYPLAERKLLLKLDISILVYCCLCFFVKYLDQTNINNAYTSGLKEDFGLYGNELNYFNVAYYSSYVVFQIPTLLLLSRPKLARFLLPTLEVLWGICTFAQSRVTTVNQLYALRFLVGMFEAPVFAGTHFILGSWYSGPELFKRAGTWFICNPLGSMISGYLQAAAYTNLSGVGGLEGWRWLFVIDGIFTIPVALIGFFVFPGIPDSPRPFYLKEADTKLAKERLVRFRIRRPGKLGVDVFKRTFSRWHIYIFVLCYICMIIASYPMSYMNLWLKAEGFSVVNINQLPTVYYAVYIVVSWLGTTLAAIYPTWAIFGTQTVIVLFSSLCMIIWNIPRELMFAAWYLFGFQGCASPILYSTVNSIVRNDSEERALILGAMMSFGYSFNIWVPLLAFPTSGAYGAPQWQRGWPITFVFWLLLFAGFIAAILLHKHGEKQRQQNGQAVSEESSEEAVSVGVQVHDKSS